MTDEISKMLTLSTAHITKATADALNDGLQIVTFNKGEYGWFWFLHLNAEPYSLEEISADLLTIVAHAQSLGCEWLCLDRAGPVNPNLPTWEW